MLLAVLLSVPASLTPLAQAAELPGRPDVPGVKSTKVRQITTPQAKAARAKVAQQQKADQKLVDSARAERASAWPKASTSTTDLARASKAKSVVEVEPVKAGATSASGKAKITVLDQEAARRAGVTGVLFTVAAEQPGSAQVTVDYGAFASAVGGNWASRLGLVRLPACALTTPAKEACRTTTPVASDNDVTEESVTSRTSVASTAAPTVMALTATAATISTAGSGDFKATPLAASSTWEAGGSSGAFAWSYPITAPPAAAGPAPALELSYSSAAIDGRTANTNNQGSMVGEGFDLTSSYIERKYGVCDDDGQDDKSDLCWKYDNASLVLNGSASELVKDDTTGVWHLKNDDASKVTHLTDADNSDADGEYWKVVTGDGTTYTFGLNKLPGAGSERTDSVWTTPVFGDDSGEPGYDKGSEFKSRSVTQAWRWNLDLVEDPRGNAATYWYAAETNNYAKNGDKAALASYTRGGYLEEIRYGQRSDTLFSAPASNKVTFTYKERCTASDCSSLTEDTADDWPDVPFDAICSADEDDCNSNGPSFFTRKRLTSINTYFWSRAAEPDAFLPVDAYTLDQEFFDGQDIGNSSDQVLVLKSLTHTGKNGPDISVPPVDFTYQQRPNRVDSTSDDILALTRPRIASIIAETGAITSVTFSDPECVRGSRMPAAEDDNRLSCYPVYWNINGGDPALDWFHKYRVTAITTNDPGAGNPGTQTSYTYDTPGWHYNDDPFTKEKERTWSIWRGYQKVTAYSGDAGATRSKTVKLFAQGMDSDKKKDGTTRTAVVAGIDLDNTTAVTTDNLDVADLDDRDYYAGQLRQEIVYDGATAVSMTVNNLWAQQTASQQKSYANIKAYFLKTARTYTYTYLTAAKKWRAGAVTTTYDSTYGMTTSVENHGDWSVTGDETCTRTWYARNGAKGLTSLVSRTRTVAKPCATTEASLTLPANSDTRGDVLSDTATVYDSPSAKGWAPDQVPTLGLPTWTGRAKAYPAASGTPERNPLPATGWQTVTTTTYDTAAAKLGRPISVTDAKGRTTTTAYYPAAAGPMTTKVITQPKLASNGQAHQTTTVYDPARGPVSYTLDQNTQRTENTYDSLGRVTATWLPNRSGGGSPNVKYGYGMERDKAPWTSVATLKADGATYTTSYALYDAQLRPIQTQVTSPKGGRVLTDTRYDSRGLAYETYADVYDNTTEPTSTYSQVPYGSGSQTGTEFDGAGRPTTSTLLVDGVKKWSTTTTYTGDSTATTAVQGGNAIRAITDVFGRTVETRTYAGTAPNDTEYGATTGTSYTSVRNTYTGDDKQDTITGPDNAKWSYTYDLFGRQVKSVDPDKGTTVTGYTDLDQIDTAKDAENRVLLYGYDELGRTTDLWQTTRTDANKLAAWTFDTVLKGLPTASTRYEGGKSYTRKVTAYDTLGRATATALTLPSDDPLVTSGAVGATTAFETTYRLDGTVGSTKSPAAGGLASEIVETRYNSAGLPNELSGTSGYLLAADYTALGQVGQLQLGTAAGTKRVFVTNTWEKGTDRLLNAAVDDQTRGPVQELAYDYDQAGNVTSITDGADIGTGTDNQCLAYDAQRRLTEAWTPETADCTTSGRTTANLGGPAPYWTSYTYNTSGQRKTEKQNTATPVTTTYCYNDTTRPHALTATTTGSTCTGVAAQYTYDDTGNTEKRVEKAGSTTAQSLAWGAEGELTRVTEGTAATATNYLYDADGELLIRRDNATDGETVLYLGTTEVHLKTGQKWANRYYGVAGSTIALRTNQSGTEKLSFLAADQHGTSSVSLTADSTQALTKRYSTPFGASRGATTGVWPDDKGFLGKSADAGTGLTHVGAREYDPSVGQFISVDPILDPAAPQTVNGYSYAANNPVSFSDPTGTILVNSDGTQCSGGWTKCGPGRKSSGSGGGTKTGTGTGGGNDDSGWVSTHAPTTNDLDKLMQVFSECSPNGHCPDGDYWNTPVMENSGPAQACFGKLACAKAYRFLLRSDDVEEAKHIAATYCLANFNACVKDAKAYERGKLIESFIGALITGGRGIKGSKGVGRTCMCFLAGTDVLLAEGRTKDIEDIEVGDKVVATDPETGETGLREVTRLIVTDSDKHFNELSLATEEGTEKLTATYEHPFWSPSQKRWIEAADLTVGMTLRTDNGSSVTVTANRSFTRHVRTYNLTVEGLHTYYVLAGNTPVLVHNASCGPSLKNLPKDYDRRTVGILDVGNEQLPMISGPGGQSGLLKNLPGRMKANAEHVETHAAAFLRMNPGIRKAVLYIDYPTGACGACRSTLPDMLPEGTQLWVISPQRTEKFVGLPD
ncbi:polymorphic toxin-type HINT domain-containing protein [Streptomyces avermitilis]|uniref:polymorphic toxin-type HINT domain-containing protein n=1 Tax=Streptomyces avermitilis TaxID=33903 RepID=UPI0038245A03